MMISRQIIFSFQLRLFHNRDQCTLRQLWVIRHHYDQISFFIPVVNMAAGLEINLESNCSRVLMAALAETAETMGLPSTSMMDDY